MHDQVEQQRRFPLKAWSACAFWVTFWSWHPRKIPRSARRVDRNTGSRKNSRTAEVDTPKQLKGWPFP
jgi:hypothetical protein